MACTSTCSPATKINLLKQVPLLAELPEEEAIALAAVLEYRQVKKGQCVLRAAEPGQFVMFIVAGKLRVVLTSTNGREYVVDLLGAGDLFGELALLTGAPRSADVEAAEDSVLLVLGQQDFEQHFLSNANLTRALLRELARRLRGTTTKVGELALLDVYRRLPRVLLSLSGKEHHGSRKQDSSEQDGQEHPNETEIHILDEVPTHRELAALTGTSREMITRALKELRAAGHIEFAEGKLILHSLPI